MADDFICFFLCCLSSTNIIICFQNLEKVLELFCVLLAQVVNSGGGAGGLRQRLSLLAEHVSRRLRSADGTALSAALVEAYTKLCKLMTFFDQFHSENYEGALEVRIVFILTVIVSFVIVKPNCCYNCDPLMTPTLLAMLNYISSANSDKIIEKNALAQRAID